MQQYNHLQSNIQIKFFIITEHLSFIPTPIINACQIINIGRPSKEHYLNITNINQNIENNTAKTTFMNRISNYKNKSSLMKRSTKSNLYNNIELDGIMNLKDTRYFEFINDTSEFPKEVFNIICDNIIKEIESTKKVNFTDFRDTLYDILTYNLDTVECLSYIIEYFIESKKIKDSDVSDILEKTYVFLKYYNNNYRPIYHLESIMFYIINKLHKY
jgi:hypothetical protein